MAPSHSTTMTRTFNLFLALFLGLAVAFVGCDTNEDDPIDENLVGVWNASSASVDLAGISVPIFEAGDDGELAVTFGSDDAFTFVVAGPLAIEPPFSNPVPVLADGEGATIEGTYTFTAGGGTVGLTPMEVDGQPVTNAVTTTVPLTFDDNDTVVLTIENTDEGRQLLGILLGGEVPQDIIDNIDGAELTFRRAS